MDRPVKSGSLGQVGRTIALGLALVLVAIAVMVFTPISDPDLTSRPDPVADYQQAVAKIEAVADTEAELPLIEHGESYALLTGARTATAVVLFHGYTNTPDEFRLVAQAYRAAGNNVWVPRLPFHSPADKFSDDFSKLTAEGLRDFVDQSVDIAAGLGDEVVVLGLSGGGTLAAWAGLERAEVSSTILLSPLFSPGGYPDQVIPLLTRGLRLSPVDSYQWWNPDKGAANTEGMVYPRYSLKGIAALLDVRLWLEKQVEQNDHPMSGSVLLVSNAGDSSVDAEVNERLVRNLAAPDKVTVVTIPASAGLSHDFIAPDPEFATEQQVTTAYGLLGETLGLSFGDPLQDRAR